MNTKNTKRSFEMPSFDTAFTAVVVLGLAFVGAVAIVTQSVQSIVS
jgi:hypothetical protein